MSAWPEMCEQATLENPELSFAREGVVQACLGALRCKPSDGEVIEIHDFLTKLRARRPAHVTEQMDAERLALAQRIFPT